VGLITMENIYRIMLPGALPYERYLDFLGEFGSWEGALTFNSLSDALKANKKTGLCTHIVDEDGMLQTWS
tara:strand:+ start:107997 stop:108206 length:210 start_codon:yes stop_codon:yes gene_type:complete